MEKGDCSFLLGNKEPSHILTKALVLLEHQVTKDEVERQLKTINQYIFVSKDGYFVRDLGNLMHLFEILKMRISNEPRFEKTLGRLLDLCIIPPRIIKCSDVLTYSLDIKEYFSWFGYLLVWSKDEDTQFKVLDVVYKLLTINYPDKRYYLSLAVRKEKAHNSILAELLGELLAIAEDGLYNNMLRVLPILIEGSKKTCVELLKKEVISSIIVRMEPTWRERLPSRQVNMPLGDEVILHTEHIFHVLTLLLEHVSVKTMKAPSKFTLWSLQWAFRYFCIKETTRIERNNVLGILLSLLEVYPDLLSGNLTFCYDIAMLAMSSDIIFIPNWTTEIKLTNSIVDHSCMALLLMCISYFPNCLSGPKVIEECRVVMGLLKLIGHQQTIKWQQLQSCYLIRLALNILHEVISASTEEFIEDGGTGTIIQLLNRSREVRNSYSYDIVFRSVELLAYFSYKFKSVCESVAYNGGVACIKPLLEDYLEQRYLSPPYQIIVAVGICLLEQICAHDEITFVLPLILKYMKRYIEPNREDPIQNPKLIIIVLSFIWNKITCSVFNSNEFVKKSGVYLLLDIIQMSCLPVKLVALGTLIDLCEIVECIPYLITWRNNGQRIKSLLIDIFRQECKEIFVKTNENGLISDSAFPIMGRDQYYKTFCSCNHTSGNPSIGDMFVSCRVKVYCLLQILNSKQRETVEIVNEFYKLYDEELSVENEVTLLLAENYLALKLAEEWKELEKDFEKMGLEPIPSDDATIGAMIQVTNQWGIVLQEMQMEVLRKHQLKESEKEQDLYTRLRNSRLSDAWDALCQMRYIAHCSERLFRITSTFNLNAQIINDLAFSKHNGQLHRTLPSNISISCVHNQCIEVPTDIREKSLSVEGYVYSPAPSLSRLASDDLINRHQETEYVAVDTFLTDPLIPGNNTHLPSSCLKNNKSKGSPFTKKSK